MFKKLVSNLPFNPGLMQQVAFYGKRLHSEKSIRKLGLVFMVGTLLINIFAISFPAQNTFAGSDSNIMVGGGASTREGILQKYDQDPWVQAVYASFDISRADIEKMVPDTIAIGASKLPPWNQNLMTAGRRPNGSNGETPRDIAGANIYVHTLDSAFVADRVNVIWCPKEQCGRYKAIILVCGNPITDANETPQPPEKNPIGYVDGISCTSVFGWAYNNEFDRFVHIYVDKPAFGGAVPGTDYFEVAATQDTRPDVTAVYPQIPSSVGWSWDGGPLRDDTKDHKLWIYVTDRTSHYALLTGGDGIAANFSCPKPVVNTCPDGPLKGKPAPDNDLRNCPQSPIASCTKLSPISSAFQINTDARFTVSALALNGASIKSYTLDYGDGTQKTYNSTSNSYDAVHKYTKLGTYKVVATVSTSEGDKTSPDCTVEVEVKPQPVPCPYDDSLLLSDTAKCIPCPENSLIPQSNTVLCVATKTLSKKVSNITKGNPDANNTTASPGDILEYTLLTTNTAKKLSITQNTSEFIGDLLDYSEVAGLNDAKLNNKTLEWPSTTIVAGDTLKQVFRVKVKDTIPSTPPSTSDAGTFDLKMVNTYGNNTTVNLPCPVSLCVQNTAKVLPKTGAGSNLLITFLLVCMVGFFYKRNKILAKEVEIVRYEYSKGA